MPDGAATTASTDLIPPETIPAETIYVDHRTVACDGGDLVLGHPRVFLRIAGTQVTCPYCSRLYVLSPGAGGGDAH
jgi:uncharacterized Zn-finger protein